MRSFVRPRAARVASGLAALVISTPLLPSGEATAQGAVVLSRPLSNEQLVDFVRGKGIFTRVWTSEDGVRPPLNGKSCDTCHRLPDVGGSGAVYNANVHAGVLRDDGRFRPAPGSRTTLLRKDLPVPPEANAFSVRKVPPLYGLGLVEAIPDEQLLQHDDRNDRNGDGVSGRPSFRMGRVLRFGSQNHRGSLREFVRNAFELELGLTESDVGSESLDFVVAFVRFLQPPPRSLNSRDPDVVLGESLFHAIGCATCHTPSFHIPYGAFVTTDGERVDVAAMQNRSIHPYSDFLLHDMGPELDDGAALGNGESYEYRTTPLWGLRFQRFHLHDNRSRVHTIVFHGGEAASARAAYFDLTAAERRLVNRFLDSL